MADLVVKRFPDNGKMAWFVLRRKVQYLYPEPYEFLEIVIKHGYPSQHAAFEAAFTLAIVEHHVPFQ